MLTISLTLGATFVRSMLSDGNSLPSIEDAEQWLRQELPHWEAAGVTLALETYEQVPVTELVDLVARIDSPSLGICLDPANSVAALENPRETVERCAPYVAGLHIKDFSFTRHEQWVGFQLSGTPLGHGLLDYRHLMDTVRPEERGIHRVVEHWLPWQGTQTETIRLEREWTTTALAYMKEH
jgi:sugar phosphate isomerase/epimerase